MTLVLDANAAIELAFGKSKSHRVGKFIEDSTQIVVPDLYFSEICNAAKALKIKAADIEKPAEQCPRKIKKGAFL